MKQTLAIFLTALAIQAAASAAEKPKLVVAIAVDQFRYDYLCVFGRSTSRGWTACLVVVGRHG